MVLTIGDCFALLCFATTFGRAGFNQAIILTHNHLARTQKGEREERDLMNVR